MRRIAVGDIMTRNFISADGATPLNKCAKLLVRHKINTIPITNSKKLTGIINARDILWTITKQPSVNLNELKAEDIAIKKVETIKPSADIIQALEKMRTYNFRTLPVLARGELIGVITLKDILKIDPSLYTEVGELSQIKEEERKLREAEIEWPLDGFCDNCGTFSDLLKVYDQLLCPDCREQLY